MLRYKQKNIIFKLEGPLLDLDVGSICLLLNIDGQNKTCKSYHFSASSDDVKSSRTVLY